MIVFFDALLIDDDPVIHQTYERRRAHLERLVKRIPGKSDIVWRKIVDFSKPEGPRMLMTCLANAFVRRWEGLVLKPANEPYFELGSSRQRRYPARWLKLKKDCIDGFGDTADFVAIGAGYDAKTAAKLKIPNASWTHFFIACLTNKGGVSRHGETPSFLVFDCVHNCINDKDLETVNQLGRFREMKPNSEEALRAFCLSFAKMDPIYPKMSVVFKQPFVFEIAGSGFDKPPNRKIFTLRFPRVTKIHWDRDWKRCVSLNELQSMATYARTIPSGQTLKQELADWVERLNRLSGGKDEMTSWDDTQDEEDSSGIAGDSVLAHRVRMSACRGQTHVPPLLLRIDRDEMMPNEELQKNGEVTKSPALALSPANTRSESNPCSSSISSPRTQKRERTVEYDDLTEHKRKPKKARMSPPGKSKREPRASGGCFASDSSRPFQEMANSTAPTLREPLKNIDGNQEAFKVNSKLGHTMLLHNRQLVHKRLHTTQRTSKPSLQVGNPLNSACTSRTTSEVNIIRKFQISAINPASAQSSNLLAPFKANKPIIPDLEKCQIILSPFLISSTLNILSRLLKVLPTRMVSLPHNISSLQFVDLEQRPASGFRILFVVDANNATEDTASSLHQLAHHLRSWHPIHIEVWDWHILDLARGLGGTTSRIKEDIVDDLKIAEMSWVPPSDHSISTVLVQWADGSTTTEPFETFVMLERLFKV